MQKIVEQTSLFRSSLNKVTGLLALVFITGALSACQTPRPHLPMVLAREALQSAKEVDAPRYAPGFYFKAEEAFRSATNLYNDKAYDASITKFNAAKEFAEKAENSARIQRQKAGEEAL